MIQYNQLRHYFGAYLYECYWEDFGDEWGALRSMIGSSGETAMTLQAEIAHLLNTENDSGIGRVIDQEFHSCIDVTQAGISWRDWLTRVSDEAGRLAAHPGAA